MSANLGKIAITIGGDHVISNEYKRLTIVKSASDVWYLSLWDVPSNIALTNQGYWVVFFDSAMNSQQVSDNAQSIVDLKDKGYRSDKNNPKIRMGSDTSNGENFDGIVYEDDTNTFKFFADANISESTPVLIFSREDNVFKYMNHDIIMDKDISTGETSNKIVKRDAGGRVKAKGIIMTDAVDWTPDYVAAFDSGSSTTLRRFDMDKTMKGLRERGMKHSQGVKGTDSEGTTISYFVPPTGFTMEGLLSISVWQHSGWSATHHIRVTRESTRIKIETYKVDTLGYSITWSK